MPLSWHTRHPPHALRRTGVNFLEARLRKSILVVQKEAPKCISHLSAENNSALRWGFEAPAQASTDGVGHAWHVQEAPGHMKLAAPQLYTGYSSLTKDDSTGQHWSSNCVIDLRSTQLAVSHHSARGRPSPPQVPSGGACDGDAGGCGARLERPGAGWCYVPQGGQREDGSPTSN